MRRKELKKDKNMFVVEYEFNSAETSDLLRKIGSNFMREDDEGDNNAVIDALMNAIPFEIEFWEAPIFQPEILDLKFIGDRLKVKLEVHLPPKIIFPTNYKGIKLKIPDKEKELKFIKGLLIRVTN